MKRLAIVFALFFLLASTASAAVEGAWTATPSEKRAGKLHFSLHRGRHHQNGTTLDLSSFSGLSAAQVHAASSTPVQFQLQREAGTITFEGTFRNGKGAGQFAFQPNPGYESAIRNLGLKLDLDHHGEDDDEELFALALFDVSTGYIRSMQSIGYKVSLSKYMNFRIFDVTAEYVREMESLGFRDLSPEKLVETKIFKVTPQFIREMRAAGRDLPLQDYIQSQIFKVTPEFAEEMAKLGYRDLPHAKLVDFKIHKVTPEFIRDLRELGYDRIAPHRLVQMRIHRVTPEFIRELAEAGYRNVPVQKLIDMRIHGIGPDMIRKLGDAAKD